MQPALSSGTWAAIERSNVCPLSNSIKLARAIAPLDVAALRLYWLDEYFLPAEMRIEPYAIGLAQVADLHFMGFARKQGTWQGPGVAIILATHFSTMNVVATAMHELAHAIHFGQPSEVDTELPETTTLSDAMRAIALLSKDPDLDLPRWRGHGSTFTRLALHLAVRAQAAGLPAMLNDFHIADDFYGLSTAESYAITLAPEIEAWPMDRPLSDLKAEPFPAAFASLWRSDTGLPAEDCR